MRSVFAMTIAATLVAASSVAAQTTSSPPAAAPAPTAPATGAPALAPMPGTPSPGGVTQMPSPSTNSTPSQSNVDLYPPTRVLPNPAPSAGSPNPASPAQIPPSGVSQGRAPPASAQRGGANDRNPVGSDMDDCMKLWGPETPVSKQDWARACERNQAGLKKAGAVGRSKRTLPGTTIRPSCGEFIASLPPSCPSSTTSSSVAAFAPRPGASAASFDPPIPGCRPCI